MTSLDQVFDVNVVSNNLCQTESILQSCNSLLYLQEVVDTIFQQLSNKISEESSQLHKLNNRIVSANEKVTKIMTNKKESITVFSSSKYPIKKQKIDLQKTVYASVKKKTQRNEKYGHICGDVPIGCPIENIPRLGQIRKKIERERGKKKKSGLGLLPNNLETTRELLLFNTQNNPYYKYNPIQNLNNLKMNKGKKLKQKRKEKRKLIDLEVPNLEIDDYHNKEKKFLPKCEPFPLQKKLPQINVELDLFNQQTATNIIQKNTFEDLDFIPIEVLIDNSISDEKNEKNEKNEKEKKEKNEKNEIIGTIENLEEIKIFVPNNKLEDVELIGNNFCQNVNTSVKPETEPNLNNIMKNNNQEKKIQSQNQDNKIIFESEKRELNLTSTPYDINIKNQIGIENKIKKKVQNNDSIVNNDNNLVNNNEKENGNLVIKQSPDILVQIRQGFKLKHVKKPGMLSQEEEDMRDSSLPFILFRRRKKIIGNQDPPNYRGKNQKRNLLKIAQDFLQNDVLDEKSPENSDFD
ncbi:wash complex subunit 1 [Anaeramoeba flamelloides]|uniref:Wash complex subunit 1 n=1 Tax=Anaeramoeba flamelloides TaxID=1746091 RepID=A0ABQ8XED3_9EUKA|nr:wash complex subunit 1 [Anaeramoeba flamelloides]